MAKRLFLCVLFLLFGFLSNSYAVPQYYTFEGAVDYIYDESGIIAAQGYLIDSPINYTVLIDFDADGYVLQSDGSMDRFADGYGRDLFGDGYISDDNYLDYFYAEFISGTILTSNNVPAVAALNFYGVEEEYGQAMKDQFGGTVDTDLNFFTDYDTLGIGGALFIEEWVVGASLRGWQYAYDGDLSSVLESNLILTDISDVAPVPEPSTIVLMGLGLVGLAGFGRKKFKK
jgi:hypothetical protein